MRSLLAFLLLLAWFTNLSGKSVVTTLVSDQVCVGTSSPLGDITISENSPTDFAISGTQVLSLVTNSVYGNFIYDQSLNASITGKGVSVASVEISPSGTQLFVTITAADNVNETELNTITIQGLHYLASESAEAIPVYYDEYSTLLIAGFTPGVTIITSITTGATPIGKNELLTICSGNEYGVELQGSITNGIYSMFEWYAVDNPGVNGESVEPQYYPYISEILENLTSEPQTVIYTVKPSTEGGCAGAPFTVTMTVNPSPRVNIVNNKPVIPSESSTDIVLTSDIPESFFYFYGQGPESVSGYTSEGSGDKINDVLVNSIGPAQDVTYYVRAVSPDECSSDYETTIVRVNGFPSVVTSDSLALVALYNALNGPSWNLEGTLWLNGAVNQWYGVEVVDMRVVSLELGGIGVDGYLPPEIGDLTALQYLNISGFNVIGEPPGEQGPQKPQSTSRSKEQSGLKGTIPVEIGNLVNLQVLILGGNQLESPIPAQVFDLVNLRELNLSVNNFTGNIPSEIENLTLLEILQLSSNQFTGTIPDKVGALSQLISLGLSYNQLSGAVPETLGAENLPNLEYFDVSENKLTGSVPALNNSSLHYLYIRNNEFSDIPLFDNLYYGDISQNRFTFGDLEPYASLIQSSQVVSAFPQKSFSTPKTEIRREGESFVVSIATDGAADYYQWLKDEIEIPEELSNTLTRESVSVEDYGIYRLKVMNEYFSEIPYFYYIESEPITLMMTADTKDSLALVAVYNTTGGDDWTDKTNWLTGQMVSWHGITLNPYGKVDSINLQDNNLRGVLPPEIGGLTDLKKLDLSGNALASELPSEYSQLVNLQYLDLSYNQCTGSIPSWIGVMTMMYHLDLSYNQFSGNIPVELGNIATTTYSDFNYLNLSNNQFVGDLPVLNATVSIYVDITNNELTGLPTSILYQELHVENNRFTFEDLEPYAYGSPDYFTCFPQKPILAPEGNVISKNRGEGFNIQIPVGGKSNYYQWFKDDVEIPDAANDQYNIRNISTGDFGIYQLRISNAQFVNFSDAYLESEPISLVMTKANETDSLAMVALYNALGGSGWKDKTNWLEGPLDSWSGVIVSEGRVRSIILMNNQLTGTIPAAIGNLSELTYLDLGCDEPSPTSKNEITGTIPIEIVNLTNLWYLNLSFNRLEGAVPNLALLPGLSVYLNDNELTDLPDMSNGEFEFLDIRNNRFTFEDFEPNANLPMLYWSQKPFSQPQKVNLVTGDDFTTTLSIGGTANQYQWKLNGEEVPNATSGTLEIFGIRPSRGGDYVLMVTNPIAPDATLYSDTIHINVVSSVTDSLALVALYNAADGANWTKKTNWLTGPVDTWEGITVTDGRVTEIMLSDNNLTGSIPVEIGDLTELKELWLSGNALTGSIPVELTKCNMLTSLILHTNTLNGSVPDLTLINGPVWVDLHDNNLKILPDVSGGNFSFFSIQDNLFTFEDIEPNLPLSTEIFAYYPQKPFSDPEARQISTGGDFVASFDVGGAFNQYQWMKNGEPIQDATTNSLALKNINPNDAGDYTLTVKNTKATLLTLTSGVINVKVTVNTGDSLALVALYNSAGGLDWVNQTNWLSGELQTWYGVTVTLGRVTSIDLRNNKLTGSIPDEIGNLTELTYLDLGSDTEDARSTDVNKNSMVGSITPSLGTLAKLTYLNLSSNDFTGTIPDSFGNLAQLEELSLTGNNLSVGTFPSSLLNLNQLRYLRLAFCGITGAVPSQITDLTQLETLIINNNGLVDLPDLRSIESLWDVRVANNKLTFEDLESNVGVESFSYVPQDSVGVKSDIIVQTETQHTFTSSVGGEANQYKWKKNDVVIEGATDSEYAIQSTAFSDEGIYSFEVTNTIVPGLTLIGRPVDFKVSSLQRDSLALVQLYNATKGNAWTNKAGWIADKLNTWAGVTITSNRVTDVNLASNNLDGDVPKALNEMFNLKTLNLSNNKITALPTLTSLTQLTSFNVSGNKLDFGSLEPNVSLFGIMNYSNQADVGISKRDSVETGASYLVSVTVKGASNEYQWKRNNAVVSGAESSDYNIASLDRTNMGTYVCEVTNTIVPGLIIKSVPQTVLAITNLSGKLLNQSSQPITSGKITLFRITDEQGYDTIRVVNVDNSGAYSFKRILLDNYHVMGFADTLVYTGALPTFYQSTPYWEEADTLFVEGTMTDLDIITQFEPTETPVGEGVISGVVEQEENNPGGRVQGRVRVSNAGVSVRRVERSGRGMDGEILVLVAFVFTNDNGEFTIPNLPKGDYRLNVQYPGYPMDNNSFINIPIGTGKDATVKVEAVVQKDKITVEQLAITGLPEQNVYQVHAYPNPSSEFITVRFERTSPGRAIEMSDVTGSQLLKQSAHEKEVTVDVHTLKTGLYMISIKENDRSVKMLRVMVKR